MAKLTKAQRRAIDRALYHAKRAQTYLSQPALIIAQHCSVPTTTLHYVRGAGDCLFPLAKDIGSDLCGLGDAIRELETLYFREAL